MNKYDLEKGETVKVSYMTPGLKGQPLTGIGYVSEDENHETLVHVAWSHGDATTTRIQDFQPGTKFEKIRITTILRESVDWNLPDYMPVPQKRAAFEKISTPSIEDAAELLFGGHLEKGDVITSFDRSEVICLSDVSQLPMKGYRLTAKRKWSKRESYVFGVTIGYQKMIKEQRS